MAHSKIGGGVLIRSGPILVEIPYSPILADKEPHDVESNTTFSGNIAAQ